MGSNRFIPLPSCGWHPFSKNGGTESQGKVEKRIHVAQKITEHARGKEREYRERDTT